MADSFPLARAEASPAIRLQLRRIRAGLSDKTLSRHSSAIAAHARRCLRLLGPRILAGYFGIRGEIDLTKLLVEQAADGTRIAMPILDRHRPGSMHFRVWSPGAPLCRNAFGIPEPCQDARRVWRRELDVVLVPLVAFDASGHRLGMGGGYYDRYFAPRLHSTGKRPRLIGIAHAFQQVPCVERQPWDVPLDAVITEAGWTRFPSP